MAKKIIDDSKNETIVKNALKNYQKAQKAKSTGAKKTVKRKK